MNLSKLAKAKFAQSHETIKPCSTDSVIITNLQVVLKQLEEDMIKCKPFFFSSMFIMMYLTIIRKTITSRDQFYSAATPNQAASANKSPKVYTVCTQSISRFIFTFRLSDMTTFFYSSSEFLPLPIKYSSNAIIIMCCLSLSLSAPTLAFMPFLTSNSILIHLSNFLVL